MVQRTCRAKSKRRRPACLLWVLLRWWEKPLSHGQKRTRLNGHKTAYCLPLNGCSETVTLKKKTAALSSRALCTVRNGLVQHLYETLECASLAVAFESSSSRKCTIFDNVTRSVGVLKHVCQILLWGFFSVLFLVNDFVCNFSSKGPFKKENTVMITVRNGSF